MRGKAPDLLHAQMKGGITPAYAGKRAGCLSQCPQGWDHPRVCGEKPLFRPSTPPVLGSPPRMRGKDAVNQAGKRRFGITPAYAGKSGLNPILAAYNGDHPRVCGEKRLLARWAILPPGSPPRMRGKVSVQGWAGLCSRDHPRVCGEKNLDGIQTACGIGSPPRMRGKAGKKIKPGHKTGITPAYAGKSAPVFLPRRSHRGSPPRMRGKD